MHAEGQRFESVILHRERERKRDAWEEKGRFERPEQAARKRGSEPHSNPESRREADIIAYDRGKKEPADDL